MREEEQEESRERMKERMYSSWMEKDEEEERGARSSLIRVGKVKRSGEDLNRRITG